MYDIIYGNGRRFVDIPVSTSLVLTHSNKDSLTTYNCSELDSINTIQYNSNTIQSIPSHYIVK